jgi:MoaA/NifB/PqqE/SkfB family radical SAM enzyme
MLPQLKHLYINPLEACNLNCKICYTKKTKTVLSNVEILDFIARYQTVQKLESITFCGGEVFLLQDFSSLINELTTKNIFIQIISNGTIDRLSEIKQANMVNLIISLDGLENYHDQNRGQGILPKVSNYLKKQSSWAFT